MIITATASTVIFGFFSIHLAEGGVSELRWKDRIDRQAPSMRQRLTTNKYVHSAIVWVAAIFLLYLLNPPVPPKPLQGRE